MNWLVTNWQTVAAAAIVAVAALWLLRGLVRRRNRPSCSACAAGKPCHPRDRGSR